MSTMSSADGDSIKTELIAGLTSFLTMVYIVFVNPEILGQAGMDKGAVFTATCLVTAVACALMGWYAKTPIAVAPGMALNIYFTYSVVQTMAIPWPQALAIVFVSGLMFFLLTLTRFKDLLIYVIPGNLQVAIVIGISFLIALIAFKSNHLIVVDGHHKLLQLKAIFSTETALFFLGFLTILLLDYYHYSFSIIGGILLISILSLILGLTTWQGLVAWPPSIEPTFLKLDFNHFFSSNSIKALFTFFLIIVFDASGTLIGLFNAADIKDKARFSQGMNRSLTVDASASALAGLLGSASMSPYIESAAGIKAGGKTGLTALVIATGFLFMLFLYPLAQVIPAFAVGPALLYVACCMMRHVRDLNISDITEFAPAMVTILFIPLTSSIADGLGAGVILYVLIKLVTKQAVQWSLIILSLLFLLFFLLN